MGSAKALRIGFGLEPFSIEAILKAFEVPPELAAELAAGLESALGLGREV